MKYVVLALWDTETENGECTFAEMFEVDARDKAGAEAAGRKAAAQHIVDEWGGFDGGLVPEAIDIVISDKILGPYNFAGSVEFSDPKPMVPPEMFLPNHILFNNLIRHLIFTAFREGYDITAAKDISQVPYMLSCIEEELTEWEYHHILEFLTWVMSDYPARAFGSANYDDRVLEFLNREDEQDDRPEFPNGEFPSINPDTGTYN